MQYLGHTYTETERGQSYTAQASGLGFLLLLLSRFSRVRLCATP